MRSIGTAECGEEKWIIMRISYRRNMLSFIFNIKLFFLKKWMKFSNSLKKITKLCRMIASEQNLNKQKLGVKNFFGRIILVIYSLFYIFK